MNGKKKGAPMKRPQKARPPTGPSVENFRDDSMYPRIGGAMDSWLAQGTVVAPVDVLIGMGLLTPLKVEDWRRGRVPYLERVINANLTKLSRLLRILRFHAHDLKLRPSIATYVRWGKGPMTRLRFTKTGDSKLREAYSRHFVRLGKRRCEEQAKPDAAGEEMSS